MPATAFKSETARLNCRVNAQIKHDAEEAASLLGQSITNFTEIALAEKTQAVFETHRRIVLSQRDFERFVSIIGSPQTPSPQLREALAQYRQLKEAHPESNL